MLPSNGQAGRLVHLPRSAARIATVGLRYLGHGREFARGYFLCHRRSRLPHNRTGWAFGGQWLQWVGDWHGFQGTPICPHHFLTARHVEGSVGGAFLLNGVTYTATAFHDDALSDLRIVEVRRTFPCWAPLYQSGDETGKTITVFGRGRTRGEEVRDAPTHSLRGWKWG